MKLEEHPTVRKYRLTGKPPGPEMVNREWLRQVVLDAGADDVGFVEIGREELSDQKDDILRAFPRTKSLISFVCRLNRPQLQSVNRSLADLEITDADSEINQVSRRVVKALRKDGISAVTSPASFPEEMGKWPGKVWAISHKPIAVAAGLGQMGHHRCVIHPVFGNYMWLGTILTDAAVSEYDHPINFNPCIECKLCVSVCPTGAIAKDGSFDFFACLLHTYQDRIGGFLNWVRSLVTSTSMAEYREKCADSETLSRWQSLTHGGGYRCSYCISVCPAGEESIGAYVDDKKGYLSSVVKPLQDKEETVYVAAGSAAEAQVTERFPHKTVKRAAGRR